MLSFSKTPYGEVVYGRVLAVKPGSGNAADSLTIVTLTAATQNGRPIYDSKIKILFWNSEKSKLADKARKLLPGEMISARVFFDAGVESKATARELKKAGVYETKTEEMPYIVHGKIAKISRGDNYLGVYIPVTRFLCGEKIYIWYLLSFHGKVAETFKNALKKGDSIIAAAKTKKEKEFQDFSYTEFQGSYLKFSHEDVSSFL